MYYISLYCCKCISRLVIQFTNWLHRPHFRTQGTMKKSIDVSKQHTLGFNGVHKVKLFIFDSVRTTFINRSFKQKCTPY